MLGLIFSFYLFLYIHFGLQICLEETSKTGIRVKWEKTLPANNVKSDPLCYYNDRLITRNCVDTKWDPPATEVMPCLQIANSYNVSACPPGFDKISKNNNDNCYQIKKPSAWDYPCFKSGGASVITDLVDEDVVSLLNSLRLKNVSQYFWLPALRSKFFSPLVWHIPGSNWGHSVETNNSLNIHTSILKNCLLLDIRRRLLLTETCTEIYPSLCFYVNDLHYPAKCPPNYLSVKYMPNKGVCLGLEEPGTNLTFNDFLNNEICKSPMGDKDSEDLARFVFKKIAIINDLADNTWCWFSSSLFKEYKDIISLFFGETYVSINNIGTISLMNSNTLLPCMACQTEVIYEKTQLFFEYNEQDKVMYLTIYFPSGLWKYSRYDRGIQCFSDGKGFVKVIDINDLPLIEVKSGEYNTSNFEEIDKTVYKINIITDRAAQYWCEGHTTNFSLIKTEILVVNPHGNEIHVFSLVINIYISPNDIQSIIDSDLKSELCSNITYIFSAKKVLLMEFLEYSSNYLMILLHMDIPIDKVYEDNARNVHRIYNSINNIAKIELPKYNYIFVNLSSSMSCLPTISTDNSVELHWELTSIGHIAAPKQFCLQENGLPVKRLCDGSYLLGSFWGNVEGVCNQNYQPSDTTTFLYKFVKGQIHENDTFRFLTDGLSFVLDDIDIIIPADIYYLSMSLQHVSSIAHDNNTSIDMGNIDNIAWVTNRVMVLNNNYLRLAQTLNSTNVILDSLNNIIELLARKNDIIALNSRSEKRVDYELSVQPQFIIQISYPWLNNVSGIAIIKTMPDDNIFTSMKIKPLFVNTSLEEVLMIENLEIATWLPDTVLKTLKRHQNESDYGTTNDEVRMHIIITVFHNDAIFQELETNQYSLNSRIIGVSFPGFLTNLVKPMPLVYRDLTSTSYEKLCGFWNFQPHSAGNVPGYWSNSGCFLKNSENGLTVCDCYHLTHFGQLLNIGRYKNHTDPNVDKHTQTLNIISLVGSFLSLLGITGIWITASVFHSWRKKAGTKVLLHLSASIALPLVFMIVFNLDNTVFIEVNGIISVSENLRVVCISLGALLHYSVLASFMWMLITAALQFIRYVRVLGVYRPSRFMIKFTLIGWGTPIIPVVVVLALDKENYIPNILTGRDSKSLICYPSGFYLIVSVIVPICIILAINITLFVLVICAISKGPDGKMRRADIDLIGAQLRLSIFLFFLLGLTWIFGVLSFSNNPLWSYLFCLTSTMQGFVLFVYFIICDTQTRNLWVTLMKPQSQTDTSRKSITSITSN